MKILDKIDLLLTEGKESDYMYFIKLKLKEYGVDNIKDLSPREKERFFKEVENEWIY